MKSKKIGIVTIHRIHNFGSVLQTYALWKVLRERGHIVEVIDYTFPNEYHLSTSHAASDGVCKYPKVSFLEKIIKIAYAPALIKQHRLTDTFLSRMNVTMSDAKYATRDQLLGSPPKYNVYISGSDQIWNPRYTNGDDIFLLSFASDTSKKISYGSSFGVTSIPQNIIPKFAKYLNRYDCLSVREDSGVNILKKTFSRDSICVLDPTLLLNGTQWRSALDLKTPSNKNPYIFCYFLNYSFDAFPYAEEFALHMKEKTGLKVIFGGRPPKRRFNYLINEGIEYHVGIGPEGFVSLIDNARLVITTSFHGTAFAVNMGKPVYSIVSTKTGDDRQAAFLRTMGLDSRIVELNSTMPQNDFFNTGDDSTTRRLAEKRQKSLEFLIDSIK